MGLLVSKGKWSSSHLLNMHHPDIGQSTVDYFTSPKNTWYNYNRKKSTMTGVLGWYDPNNLTFYPPWYDTGISQMAKNVFKKKNKCRPFYQKETKKKHWRVTRICWSPIKTPKIWDTWPLTWNNLETKPALENHLWTYPKFQSKGWNILKNCDIQDIWKVKPWNLLCFSYLLHLGISWNALKLFLKKHERTEASNPALNVLMACLGWLTIGLCPEFWKEIHPGNLT